MKETVLDVLMYLFENYFDDEGAVEPDQESLRQELVQAGFPEEEIGKAFAQMVFHKLSRKPDALYNERSGNFQGQRGVTLEKKVVKE